MALLTMIDAIKVMRHVSGVGLKEAKDIVEELINRTAGGISGLTVEDVALLAHETALTKKMHDVSGPSPAIVDERTGMVALILTPEQAGFLLSYIGITEATVTASDAIYTTLYNMCKEGHIPNDAYAFTANGETISYVNVERC